MTIETLKAMHKDWTDNIKPDVIAQYGADDEPALSESWSNFTDALCKNGELTELQYSHCPSWDETIPDDDVEFILDELGLRFDAEEIAERPDNLMSESATHWRCTFGDDPQLVVYFSQGSFHTGEPEAREVLECVIGDSDSVVDCDSFEEFADSMGYDEDSRAAERIYNACKAQRENLLAVLSEDQISQFQEMLEDC